MTSPRFPTRDDGNNAQRRKEQRRKEKATPSRVFFSPPAGFVAQNCVALNSKQIGWVRGGNQVNARERVPSNPVRFETKLTLYFRLDAGTNTQPRGNAHRCSDEEEAK